MTTGVKANVSRELPERPERATLEGKNKVLGMWLFLAGETVLFASFFAAYIALRKSSDGGPTAQELFHLELVFIMTVILLSSSLTSLFAVWAMQRNAYRRMQQWFIATALLGVTFLGFEIYEFVVYVQSGLGFSTNAFATTFYALVGLHGFHVLLGVCWITLLLIQARRHKINTFTAPKFYVFSLYWHFVDVVWVFVFTAVYLLGKAV